jgi:hypothetical protein
VCLVSGHDESFAQTVHAKTSYDGHDVRWGGRFRVMYLADRDHVAIDIRRIHQFEPVTPPTSL